MTVGDFLLEEKFIGLGPRAAKLCREKFLFCLAFDYLLVVETKPNSLVQFLGRKSVQGRPANGMD